MAVELKKGEKISLDKKPDETLDENLENRNEKRKFPRMLVICIALVIGAIGVLAWLLVIRYNNDKEADLHVRQTQQTAQTPISQVQSPVVESLPPSAQVSSEAVSAEALPPVQVSSETAVTRTPPPVIQSPVTPPAIAAPDRWPPPVASYNIPSVIPLEGVPYRIQYGDTLWDIAQAFYSNPRLYLHIARFNNIHNPDVIISGTTIRVPPRD